MVYWQYAEEGYAQDRGLPLRAVLLGVGAQGDGAAACLSLMFEPVLGQAEKEYMMTMTYNISAWPGEILTFNGRLDTDTCPTCHILHAFPEEMYRRALRFNKTEYPKNTLSIYCPNGHGWHYDGKNEEQRRLEQTTRELEIARHQRDVAKQQAATRKGQLTRMRNRYAAGICPVGSCRANLGDRVRDHIAHQHPEFRFADIE